jgi:hypothetical protein
MKPGMFTFRLNVPVKLEGGEKQVNIPIDAVIMPIKSKIDDLPPSSAEDYLLDYKINGKSYPRW